MKPNTKEIEAVIKLDPFERYKYFIKKIADTELLYTLVNEEGDFLITSLEDKNLLPVWSANEFAENILKERWKDFSVKQITLDSFREEIIQFVNDNDYLFNIFPVSDRTGFVVSSEELEIDLNEELEKY